MKSAELFERVSSQMAAQIAAGANGGQWKMPWKAFATGAPKSVDGRAYRGMNPIILAMEQSAMGYEHAVWGTYKAWARHGAQVRKGERSTRVVLWKTSKPKDEVGDNGEVTKGKARLFATVYSVFNVAQVDGYSLPAREPLTPIERDARAESFLDAIGADVKYGGSQAYYAPFSDSIHLPIPDAFDDHIAFYGTSAHEHIHWSGAKGRLDRTFGKRFGDDAYAVEELTAEIGAAMVCAYLEIEPAVRLDHSAYVEHWLRVLRTDTKAIVSVASAAQKAFDYLAKFSAPIEDDVIEDDETTDDAEPNGEVIEDMEAMASA